MCVCVWVGLGGGGVESEGVVREGGLGMSQKIMGARGGGCWWGGSSERVDMT